MPHQSFPPYRHHLQPVPPARLPSRAGRLAINLQINGTRKPASTNQRRLSPSSYTFENAPPLSTARCGHLWFPSNLGTRSTAVTPVTLGERSSADRITLSTLAEAPSFPTIQRKTRQPCFRLLLSDSHMLIRAKCKAVSRSPQPRSTTAPTIVS
jgi:hypothetical protein